MTSEFGTWFTGDPAAFLDRAGDYLRARPLTATVVATNATRWRDSGVAPGTPYDWFCVLTQTGADGVSHVVGAAMRTAPAAPWPPYLLDAPDGAVRALVDALRERGEEVSAVTGMRPAVDVFGAACGGAAARVGVHFRIFELGTLVPPPPVSARLRTARVDEAPLVAEWLTRFHHDVEVAAGRPVDPAAEPERVEVAEILPRVTAGRVWFLVDDDDRPLQLTAASPPAFGVVRIGPVFTPAEHRGRGLAGAAVAEVAAAEVAAGHRVVLFTDQANPTSNALYVRLGFEPVDDTALVVW